MVADAWQGKGLGTEMMSRLIELAKENGIKGFTASLLESNHSMLRLFHKSGCPVEVTLNEGCYEVHMPFTSKAAEPEKQEA